MGGLRFYFLTFYNLRDFVTYLFGPFSGMCESERVGSFVFLGPKGPICLSG